MRARLLWQRLFRVKQLFVVTEIFDFDCHRQLLDEHFRCGAVVECDGQLAAVVRYGDYRGFLLCVLLRGCYTFCLSAVCRNIARGGWLAGRRAAASEGED